jgi:hypothetical protein
LKLIKPFKILKASEEIKMLAEAYLEVNIIPKDYINDAIQIATTSGEQTRYPFELEL